MNKKIESWFNKNINYDFNNKNILVTGASSGIGLEFSKLALEKGSNIIMAVRNKSKANLIKQDLLKINDKYNIKIYELDLSDFTSIDKFIDNIIKNKIDIDVFYNNAGVFRIKNKYTIQGYELVFGTNYIGTYYLSNKILSYLESLNHKVNFILSGSVTGLIYKLNNKNIFDLNTYPLKIYGRSKRALLDYYLYLLNKYKNTNIVISLVHPGAVYTSIIENGYKRKWFKKLAKIFMNIFLNSLEIGSLSAFLAISNKSGFYGPNRLLKLKGYPKKNSINKKYYKNYINTINQTNSLLNRK